MKKTITKQNKSLKDFCKIVNREVDILDRAIVAIIKGMQNDGIRNALDPLIIGQVKQLCEMFDHCERALRYVVEDIENDIRKRDINKPDSPKKHVL